MLVRKTHYSEARASSDIYVNLTARLYPPSTAIIPISRALGTLGSYFSSSKWVYIESVNINRNEALLNTLNILLDFFRTCCDSFSTDAMGVHRYLLAPQIY